MRYEDLVDELAGDQAELLCESARVDKESALHAFFLEFMPKGTRVNKLERWENQLQFMQYALTHRALSALRASFAKPAGQKKTNATCADIKSALVVQSVQHGWW